jgi:hypothetical protein
VRLKDLDRQSSGSRKNVTNMNEKLLEFNVLAHDLRSAGREIAERRAGFLRTAGRTDEEWRTSPMQEQSEIWRTANLLVDRVGEAAPGYASKWARELLVAGDVDRRADWLRVMVACKALLSQAEANNAPRA